MFDPRKRGVHRRIPLHEALICDLANNGETALDQQTDGRKASLNGFGIIARAKLACEIVYCGQGNPIVKPYA